MGSPTRGASTHGASASPSRGKPRRKGSYADLVDSGGSVPPLFSFARHNLVLRCQVCGERMDVTAVPEHWPGLFRKVTDACYGTGFNGGASAARHADAADQDNDDDDDHAGAGAGAATTTDGGGSGGSGDGDAVGRPVVEVDGATAEAELKSKFETGDHAQFAAVLSAFCSQFTDVDLPVCAQCTFDDEKGIKVELTQALAAAKRRADQYEQHERLVTAAAAAAIAKNGAAAPSARVGAGSQRRLGALTDAERFSPARLQALLHEETRLKSRVNQLQHQVDRVRLLVDAARRNAEKLAALEDRYWEEVGRLAWTVSVAQERLDSFSQRKWQCDRALAKLHNVTALNDAFFIWHDGPFGTINGFRMGRLPSLEVDWTEINAAFGHAAMLVASIASRVGLTFEKYNVLPMGSYAKVVRVDDERIVSELYWDSKMFSYNAKRRLNAGIKGFLVCVQELADFAQTADLSFSLPYDIVDDKVSGMSVVWGGNLVQWTRGLKSLLTNLKWLMSWASRNTSVSGGGIATRSHPAGLAVAAGAGTSGGATPGGSALADG